MLLKHCLFIPLILIANLALAEPTSLEYIFEPDEYIIYAAVIDDWYADNNQKTPLIKDHTVFYTSQNKIRDELSYVYSQMPALDSETINDFVAKNLQTYPLEKFINQRAAYQFIPETELINLFKYGEEGWKRLRSRYPDADGVLSLSRVGFNITKGQALVCIANQWDRLTGVGLYVLLEKQKDSSWAITKTLHVWNSWCLELPIPAAQ